MARTTHERDKLSFSEKLARLGARLRDPEWRRYGFVMASGKVLGLAVILGMMILIPLLLNGSPARADVPPPGNPPAAVAGISLGLPAALSKSQRRDAAKSFRPLVSKPPALRVPVWWKEVGLSLGWSKLTLSRVGHHVGYI